MSAAAMFPVDPAVVAKFNVRWWSLVVVVEVAVSSRPRLVGELRSGPASRCAGAHEPRTARRVGERASKELTRNSNLRARRCGCAHTPY